MQPNGLSIDRQLLRAAERSHVDIAALDLSYRSLTPLPSLPFSLHTWQANPPNKARLGRHRSQAAHLRASMLATARSVKNRVSRRAAKRREHVVPLLRSQDYNTQNPSNVKKHTNRYRRFVCFTTL